MSCGVGHRCSLDLVLLWLWHRPVATALIGPLAWEFPYATGEALKKKFRSPWLKDSEECSSHPPAPWSLGFQIHPDSAPGARQTQRGRLQPWEASLEVLTGNYLERGQFSSHWKNWVLRQLPWIVSSVDPLVWIQLFYRDGGGGGGCGGKRAAFYLHLHLRSAEPPD